MIPTRRGVARNQGGGLGPTGLDGKPPPSGGGGIGSADADGCTALQPTLGGCGALK